MPTRSPRTIYIDHAGQAYSGLYQTRNGVITVTSAYGSKFTPATGRSPGVIAADLLRQIVESYRRQSPPHG